MLDKKAHDVIMKDILKDLYSDRLLSTVLVFKGGTACYLFYDLPRFSVDLDFSLLDNSKNEKILEKVKKIAEKYGEIEESIIKKNTIFTVVSHKRDYQKIKIEISTRDIKRDYDIKNFLGISVLVMKKEDMFANKLLALTERGHFANRDLFDSYYFFKKIWDINEDIIKDLTEKNLLDYLKYLRDFLENCVVERKILDGLGQLLEPDQRDWARKNLKKDLIFEISNYVDSMERDQKFRRV